MNIHNVFEANSKNNRSVPGEYPLTKGTAGALIRLRHETFKGFLKLEKERGFLETPTSINSSRGQEMIRLLFARSIEELLECFESETIDHRREEAIDFFNYALSMPLLQLSPETKNPEEVHLLHTYYETLHIALTQSFLQKITWTEGNLIGEWLKSMSPVLELLRNRSWMNNAQSYYFDGWPPMFRAMSTACEITAIIFGYDWDTFIEFFIAKDAVLQFRLQTKY